MKNLEDLENVLLLGLEGNTDAESKCALFISQLKNMEDSSIVPLTKAETFMIRKYYGLISHSCTEFDDSLEFEDDAIEKIIVQVRKMLSNNSMKKRQNSSISLCLRDDRYNKKAFEFLREKYGNNNYRCYWQYINFVNFCEAESLLYFISIGELELSDSVHESLRSNGIYYIGQLLSASSSHLLNFEGISVKNIEEIKAKLIKKYGLLFIEDIVYVNLDAAIDEENKISFLDRFSDDELRAIRTYNIINLDDYLEDRLSEEEKQKIISDDDFLDKVMSCNEFYFCNVYSSIVNALTERNIFKKTEKRAALAPLKGFCTIGLEELDFSNRTLNALLKKNNISTITQLLCLTKREIYSLDGIGSTSGDEIVSKFKTLGIEFIKDGLEERFNIDFDILDIIQKITAASKNMRPEVSDDCTIDDHSSTEMSISDIPLERLYGVIERSQGINCLRSAGYRTLGEIASKLSCEDLISNKTGIRSLGVSNGVDIVNAIHSYGLSFRDEQDQKGVQKVLK